MSENQAQDRCPKCLRMPHVWRERPQYGSRELYWVGCKSCGLIAGGITAGIALHSWKRVADRAKFEKLAQSHEPLQFGRAA